MTHWEADGGWERGSERAPLPVPLYLPLPYAFEGGEGLGSLVEEEIRTIAWFRENLGGMPGL